MRKNRKRTKHSVFRLGSVGVVSLIVSIFLMLMLYWSVDSRCSSIAREIGQAEKRLAALDSEFVRVTAKWDEQKIPDRLSERLTRFGLEMKYARQDQVVRMSADGRPLPGQIAVARARQRVREGVMAQASVSETAAAPETVPVRRTSADARRRGVRR